MMGGAQWVVAALVSVAIHMLGLLWLSLVPPTRQPQPQSASEGVVVTLGRGAADTPRSAQALKPVEGPAVEAASSSPASPEANTAPVREPRLVDLDSVDTGKPVEAKPAASPPPVQTKPVETKPAVSPSLAQTKPVEARTAPAPSLSQSKPSHAAAAEPARTAEAAALVPEATSPPVSIETTRSVSAVDVSVQQQPAARPAEAQAEDAGPESGDAAPAEPVATTPPATTPPEESEATANAVQISSAAAPAVKAVEAARKPRIESVAEQSASEASGVKVATAREPAPEVEQASAPEVSEAAKPQTVDLEKLLKAEEVGSANSSGGSGVMARYAGVLKGWLEKNMHYPRAARLAGQQGKVVVRFIIDRQGNVKSIKLESRSGFPLLDREAREMIERGDPFPAMPNEMPGQELEVRVPVSFHVRQDTLTKEIPPINLQ